MLIAFLWCSRTSHKLRSRGHLRLRLSSVFTGDVTKFLEHNRWYVNFSFLPIFLCSHLFWRCCFPLFTSYLFTSPVVRVCSWPASARKSSLIIRCSRIPYLFINSWSIPLALSWFSPWLHTVLHCRSAVACVVIGQILVLLISVSGFLLCQYSEIALPNLLTLVVPCDLL